MENSQNNKYPVPAGLTRCKKCGHFKGDCVQNGEPWHISCICNRQICHRCQLPINKYEICSDIYDENNGRCWHVGIISAWVHRCPDGVQSQLSNSFLIDPRTGENLL